MADLLDRVLLPVASEEDAVTSARALARRPHGEVVVINVVEKAGGAPDKAGVEQREEAAEEMFAAAREILGDVQTDVYYGTDVTETIFDAAEDVDATAVVVTPRGGNRFVRMITGDVALRMITDNDRPVVVLPDEDADE
ncbi:universal stress protein [Haloarcula nitratireducens]|uniref:Universal stress protein n=1 Tax=Haloarcula nitratireducens TaxID=2487749 RepID=A0AAW4PA72_9EURY|nr:universal stress protein [Halomicroarcula nitratireducens]MBX0294857.1 universal stress protein [Halomicroarcula nitratireducens]